MKKFIYVMIAIVLVIGGYVMLRPDAPSETDTESLPFGEGPGRFDDDEEIEVVDLTNEIVYSGKIVPEEQKSYFITITEEVGALLVNEGDSVKKEDVLFTYKTVNEKDIINEKIVLDEQIDDLEEQIYEQKESIQEIRTWIADEDDDDQIYIFKEMIEDQEAANASNELSISSLRKQRDDLDDNKINQQADFNGLVYQVDSDQLNETNSQQAFITLISTSKVINIEVAEYELPFVSEGDVVEVTITGSDEKINGVVKSIDVLPNNINSTDTSYYNTVISVETDMPYGASAMISVKVGE